MTARTSAGSSVAIGAAAGTESLAGFQAVSYTEIGEVTNIGEFGKQYNLVTHNPISNRRTQKYRGSYNQGQLQLEMARDTADPGQADLIAANDSDDNVSIRVTLQDGTNLYMHCQVFSYVTGVGGVDDITSATAQLEINSEIFSD